MRSERAGETKRPQSPSDIALYIATLAGELAQLARRQHLVSLAYILDMAHLEADQIAKGSDGAREWL